MLKLWQKHQKFLKGNKGFSLVELIIVIAIMAALVAILAPQYLKYVEKSRVAADKTQIDEIAKAVKVCAADPDATYTVPATITVTGTEGGALRIGAATATDFEKAVIDSLGATTVTLKSTAGKTVTSIAFNINATTYAVTCVITPTAAQTLWAGN